MFKPSPRFVLFFILLLTIPACSGPKDTDAASPRITREVNALFNDLARIELNLAPETATRLGLLDTFAGEDFNARLNDRSQAGYERARLKRLEILEAIARAPNLPEGTRLSTDLVSLTEAYKHAETMAAFGHGQASLGTAYPYVMDHMRGAYIDVPNLLTQHQKVHSRKDARAYLARLQALPGTIDDERRRLSADARAGILAPRHILARMETLAASLGSGPGETHILFTNFDSLLAGPEDLTLDQRASLRSEALQIVSEEVLPAYTALRASLHTMAQTAPPAPGIWHLPEGNAYYDAALGIYTGTDLSPEALHKQGLAAVAQLTAELDIALAAENMTEGSVGERLEALTAQKDQLFEDSEEGRAALIARMEAARTAMAAHVPSLLTYTPRTQVQIRPVPDYMQISTPSAFYTAAAADGSAPGLFHINLSNMTNWPAFALPTLVYHETVPGHHTESALSAEISDLPLLRQMIWDTAYGEGWAVYGEDLADEAGVYADDPLARIGYLQSLLFRASRLVADTGLHRMRWTREDTIGYLVATTGQPHAAMADEVDRYTVWPGQAAAYWTGRTHIRDLRTRAKRVLGPKFDLAAFHMAVLKGGPRPLSVLEADIERWYGAQLED